MFASDIGDQKKIDDISKELDAEVIKEDRSKNTRGKDGKPSKFQARLLARELANANNVSREGGDDVSSDDDVSTYTTINMYLFGLFICLIDRHLFTL
jgi:hypothetical protein